MSILADQIRALVSGDQGTRSEYRDALLAVVDKCDRMAGQYPGGIGRYIADEFESVIARELGIEQ